MKKSLKALITLSLLLITLSVKLPVVYSQSLAEERAAVVESFMYGITDQFTYEEVDAYIASEEAYILETGNSRSLSSYGINGNHSTGQGIMLAEYLTNYFANNTTQSQQADLYPYAVDFNQWPDQLAFYEVGGDGRPQFTLEKTGDYLTLTSNIYYPSLNGDTNQFSGYIENNGTQAIDVTNKAGNNRTVNVNSQMSVWTTAHRREFLFSFFHNADGGLSLLMWRQENPQSTLVEYATNGGGGAVPFESSSDALDTSNYGPYLKDYYYYKGAGSPLEGGDNYREINLQFPPDDTGRYQFVLEEFIDGEHSAVTYVYQMTNEGVYEEAYFETNNTDKVDYRYHEDAMNVYQSLILPKELSNGLIFNSGYRADRMIEFVAAHDSFEFNDRTYSNVIELRYDSSKHVFLAEGIGIIGEAYYSADLDGYNLIYYLESYRPEENETKKVKTISVNRNQNKDQIQLEDFEAPYAVAIQDLNQVLRFYSPGTMNKNMVEIYPQELLMNVYYDDLKDGGYQLAYSSPIIIRQVATEVIQVNRHNQLLSEYDIGDAVNVNTQIIATDYTAAIESGQGIYLYYNVSGGLSLAYWNSTVWSGTSNGHYTEMIP